MLHLIKETMLHLIKETNLTLPEKDLYVKQPQIIYYMILHREMMMAQEMMTSILRVKKMNSPLPVSRNHLNIDNAESIENL